MDLEVIGKLNGFDIFIKQCDYGTLFKCYGDFTQAMIDNGIKLTVVSECSTPYFIAEIL